MGRFVQYVHSGKEYQITTGEKMAGEKRWNYRPSHHRKFIKSPGCYWSGNCELPAELLFWAEWEPETLLIRTNSNWLHVPSSRLDNYGNIIAPPFRVSGNGMMQYRQHTDPYIMNTDGFLLSICGQINNSSRSRMRELTRGDIVVFGSCVNGLYVVDTVFVIDEYIDYQVSNVRNDLTGFLQNTFYIDQLWPGLLGMLNNGNNGRLRCYRGATPINPYEGMFSYVPSRISNGGDNHFARPVLYNSDFVLRNIPFQQQKLISSGLRAGYNITENLDINELKCLWGRMYDVLLLKNNLLAGTSFS